MHDIKIQKEVGEKSTKNCLKKQKTKKSMEYKQLNLEELPNMFDKEQNPEELNKIMGAVVDKRDILFDENEETNNVYL